MTLPQEPEPRLMSEGRPMMGFHIRESIKDRLNARRFVRTRKVVELRDIFLKSMGRICRTVRRRYICI